MKKKKLGKAIVIVLLAVVAAVVIMYVFCGSVDAQIIKVSQGAVKDTVAVDGRIVCTKAETILSPVNGKVTEVCVTKGSTVKKGDIICKLYSPELEYAFKNTGINPEVPKKIAENEKEKLGKLLDDCTVRAAVSGVIESLPVENTNAVSESDTIAVIRTPVTPFIEADILTDIVPYLHIGDPVTASVVLKNGTEKYNGTLSEIMSFAEEKLSLIGLKEYRVHVKAKLEDYPSDFSRDGYPVRMEVLVFSSSSALAIPANAVFREDRKDYVWYVDGGKVRKKEVELSYSSSSVAVVKTGLTNGDSIIANAYDDNITDGVRVE